MTYAAIENTPITISLLKQAMDTGWSIDGTVATHVACQDGLCTLLSYPVTAGNTYQISYAVLTITSGYVQAQVGGTNGAMQTAANLYVETITAAADGFVRFYSNGNCQISAFNIANITDNTGTTIVYATENNKWSDFRNYYPDFLWSLYTTTLVAYKGQLYSAQNGGGASTNYFFGVQFQSSIKFVEAKNPQVVKDFETLNYQANMLLITTINGVLSSLGQVTTLIDTDFIKQKLTDAGLTVINYQTDQVYSASFLNDENTDIVNGDSMRGNYIVVELVTVDGSTPLQLFTVAVRSRVVFVGSRP